MQDYRYKAFISYRHQSPDDKIAEKLHTLIENYSIPLSIRQAKGTGSRMGRVFRDKEELPLSANLGDDIHKALEESEWLICICSPRYLESRWCMEEVDYFLSLGRGDKVLTILTEGEPEKAFPPQLMVEEKDGREKDKEPLAADVRAADVSGALKKLNTEKLRIFAPMLEVRYDDLMQRTRKRRLRAAIAVTAAVFALLAGFLVYSWQKNAQITAERNAALISESKWLAKAADDAGDETTKLQLYLEALPSDLDNPERPIVESASTGIINTVIKGVGTASYREVAYIKTDRSAIEIKSSPEDIFITTRKGIERYDINTGSRLDDLLTKESDIYGSFIEPGRGYYVFYQDGYQKVSFEREYVNDLEYKTPAGEYSERNYYYGVTAGKNVMEYAFRGNEKDLCISSWKTMDNAVASLHGTAEEGFIYTLNMINEPAEPTPGIFLTGHEYTIPVPERDYYYCKPHDAWLSPDKKTVMGVSLNYLYFWQKDSEDLILTVGKERFDDTYITTAVFPSDERMHLVAVLTGGGNVYLYDYIRDYVPVKLQNGLIPLQSVCWNYDDSRLLCAAGDYGAYLYSSEDGRMLDNLPGSFFTQEAVYGDTNYLGNAAADNNILLIRKGSSTQISIYTMNASVEAGKYKTFIPVASQYGETVFSEDASTVWVANNGGSLVDDYNPLCVFDAVSGTPLEIREEYGTRLFRLKDKIAVVKKRDDVETYVRIYNAADRSEIVTLHASYPHLLHDSEGTYDYSTRTTVESVSLTPDGSCILIQSKPGTAIGTPVYAESYIFVYDAETLEELWNETWYDPKDMTDEGIRNLFPQAGTDDETKRVLLLYAYPAGEDELLLQYIWCESVSWPEYSYNNYYRFERRDLKTGELKEALVPEGTYKCVCQEDKGVMKLYPDRENNEEADIVFRFTSFDNIRDEYYEELHSSSEKKMNESAEEGPVYDFGGSILAEANEHYLIKGRDGSVYVLRVPTLAEAMESAKIILNGKELSDDMRAKYFLAPKELPALQPD